MLGGQFQDHPYGSVAGTVINEDPVFPRRAIFPPFFNLTDEFYQVKNFSRGESRVLFGWILPSFRRIEPTLIRTAISR